MLNEKKCEIKTFNTKDRIPSNSQVFLGNPQDFLGSVSLIFGEGTEWKNLRNILIDL